MPMRAYVVPLTPLPRFPRESENRGICEEEAGGRRGQLVQKGCEGFSLDLRSRGGGARLSGGA